MRRRPTIQGSVKMNTKYRLIYMTWQISRYHFFK